jgi:PAS domain S-box-containing protein
VIGSILPFPRRHSDTNFGRREGSAEVAPALAEHLLYQELFDFSPDAQILTDTGGIVRAANYAAANLLHTRREFVVDKPFVCFVAYPDWHLYYHRLAYIRQGHTDALAHWPLQLKPLGGDVNPVIAQVSAYPDASGLSRMLHWQLKPVDGRDQVERALRHERHFIDSVLEAAQTLVVVLNAHNGSVLRAGAAVCAMVGRSEEELRGWDWWHCFPEPDRTHFREMMLHALAFKEPRRGNTQFLTPSGSAHTVSWAIQSLALEPDSPAIILAVGHDITELEAAQRSALQAERLATIGQVTAALAHEGRNVLQRIHGGLDRLTWRLQDQPETLEILQRVIVAQRDMTRMFDDIRSYAAPMKLEFAANDLGEIWRDAWQYALADCGDRRCELIERTAGLNLVCVVDRFRVQQVFRNILENALAACADPVCVTVSCQAVHLGDTPAFCLSFRDNGPGLNAEQRQKILEPFYTTKSRGSGLGMAIAKRIVEAHGGTIGVGAEAADGEPRGADILVTLPRSPTR